MAVTPLFVADVATVKSGMRLSGATGLDVDALIANGISHTRIAILSRLGTARVQTVLAMPQTDNPMSDDEITRTTANLVEICMVRQQLLRTMPTMFIDGNSANAMWNQENIARETPQNNVQKEIDRLNTEIENGLNRLELGAGVDVSGSTRVFDGTPDPTCMPKRVGNSIRRGNGFW